MMVFKIINHKKENKREGYALITVLVVLVVMSILLVTSFTLLQSNTKQIRSQEENLKAHYLARSGAMLAYTAILNDSGTKLLDQFSTSKFYNETEGKKETIEFTDEKAEAKVNAWYNNGYIIIKSESEIKNSSVKSTIYLKFEKSDPENLSWSKNLD